jgi:hypothetical protein
MGPEELEMLLRKRHHTEEEHAKILGGCGFTDSRGRLNYF